MFNFLNSILLSGGVVVFLFMVLLGEYIEVFRFRVIVVRQRNRGISGVVKELLYEGFRTYFLKLFFVFIEWKIELKGCLYSGYLVLFFDYFCIQRKQNLCKQRFKYDILLNLFKYIGYLELGDVLVGIVCCNLLVLVLGEKLFILNFLVVDVIICKREKNILVI